MIIGNKVFKILHSAFFMRVRVKKGKYMVFCFSAVTIMYVYIVHPISGHLIQILTPSTQLKSPNALNEVKWRLK
jgi:hypothetical protein